MAGLYNGVQAKFMEMEKRAMFVHCLAHCFDLTLQDTVKAVPECRNALNVMKDLMHFVRDSPKRLDLFAHLKANASTNLKPLCPTRWAARYLAMSSVLPNYTELQEFFLNVSRKVNSDSGAKANGFFINMQTYDFFFVLSLLGKLFGHIDTVNIALQRKSLHLEKANKMISTLVTSIKFMRNNFESFWGEVTSKCQDMDVDSPKLSRRRKVKVPKKYDDSINLSVETFTEVCDKYRRLYYETMDTSISFLESRFKTQQFMFVNQIEQFLLGDNKRSFDILSFYKSDIDKERLLLHRSMFHEIIQSSDSVILSSLDDIVKYLKQENHLFDPLPELVKFMRVVLTIPIMSCTAEQSFLCLRRVKTYLRSIMR
ncbi:uncharacterized protein LOC124795997 [Schistocerca piceifrons]|uniref:uncharacterized protein LOC124795997 n=1 Tax=Schistocerca piceifrons TaxID=274613 RepID=UPI001F5ED13A|nr:uncharacterized protein LOC124795997 [Schistocerca piceifrons]